MEDPKLQQLANELNEAIKRVDALQRRSQNMSWTARIGKHVDRHGAVLVNVIMAGTALLLAVQKVQLKNELEV
jgi:flagellar hook-basal body complex protein FliE